MKIIEMKEISKKYGQTTVLKNVDLQIEEGDFVSIMGSSGAGKSTLLNIIGLMDTATDGEYVIDGEDIKGLNNTKLSFIRNMKIGFVFQNFALMNSYNIYDNIELPLFRRKMSSKERKRKVLEVAKKLKIEEHLYKMPNQLSGGQQQRAGIARALIGEGKLILADEPTGALDKNTGIEIMEIFKKLNEEGKTIIVITHDSNVNEYAKRKISIEDGELFEYQEHINRKY
ncbi:MAG: ABC transporter ATP-binding protein [Romboutsia sp.]|uniref:ABC transporter ATP-binding protein n=1 Tax=Clostridia TaxID=186801 RepID=UPI003EE7AC48